MTCKKILVAIDTSLQASKVFQEALDIAQKSGGQLMLYHCINSNFLDDPALSIG